MTKVTVFSALCGSGKTNKMIQMMAESSNNIIYVTPLLSECHRIAGTSYDENDVYKRPLMVSDDEYYYDETNPLKNKRFRHPTNSKGETKLSDAMTLIENGYNIVSTHSLFSNFTPSIANVIQEKEYTLFLDEVVSIYEPATDILDINECKQLIKSNVLSVDADGITLRFNNEKIAYTENTRFDTISNLCALGQLLIIDEKIVLWEFPVDIIKSFKEIYISTYMFEGSQLCAFLKSNGIDYTVEKFGLLPSQLKDKITIVDDRKMNEVGDKVTALSAADLVTKKHSNNELRKRLLNFFNNITKANKNERLWTTFKQAMRVISGGRYSASWLSYNTKATNDYSDTWAIAYLLNLFHNPMIEKALCYKNVQINEKMYALSELIQFIFRSRIRNGEPITVYIPSKRMRDLFISWLNDEFE